MEKNGGSEYVCALLIHHHDGRFRIAELRHTVAYGSPNIGRIANDKLVVLNLDIIPRYLFFEAHSSGNMVGILQHHNIQFQKIVNQNAEQYGAVFAVGERIVENLISEQRSLVAKLLLVGFVREGGLNKVQQNIGGLKVILELF